MALFWLAVPVKRLNDGADMTTRTQPLVPGALARRSGVAVLALLLATLIAALFALPGCQTYDTLVEKDAVCDSSDGRTSTLSCNAATTSFPIW